MSFIRVALCLLSELFDIMSEFYISFTGLTSADKFNVNMSYGKHCYRVAFAKHIPFCANR